MIRLMVLLWVLLGSAAWSQDSVAARIDTSQSYVRDVRGDLQVALGLTAVVPYRVFTLDAPRRLVIDFREVDWTGVTRDALLQSSLAADLRFGVLRPGWSRMVVDLTSPLAVSRAGMRVDDADGTAVLTVLLEPVTPDAFAASAGAPPDPGWGGLITADIAAPAPKQAGGPLVVVIDPGHGGIDPGANRGGMREAVAMLRLGMEVAAALDRVEGISAVLTRDADIFVPLEERITIARSFGADLLISLHADALEEDEARGASVYTLSQEASDAASLRMAERHERGDLLAGLDLSQHEDRVATVLMDLVRLDTAPQSLRFADTLVAALRDNGVRVNSRPRREGQLAVLNAADFASVLVEVGFLSNARDRAALASARGRTPFVSAIVAAVQAWAAQEAARAPLIRQ